jgi:hypothetical protein
MERCKERIGYYPERVLAYQINRTRDNREYCKKRGIRLSEPKLGRPSKTVKGDRKVEYKNNADRIEVERTFSISKRCYGMDQIVTKFEETQLTSIALSVFVLYLSRFSTNTFCSFITFRDFSIFNVPSKSILAKKGLIS